MSVAFVPIGVELVREALKVMSTSWCTAIRAKFVVPNGTAANAGVVNGMILKTVGLADAHAFTIQQVNEELKSASIARPVAVTFSSKASSADCSLKARASSGALPHVHSGNLA